MHSSTAYFLVAHGSRDRRLSAHLSQLQQQFLSLALEHQEGVPPVATGTLEFGPDPLETQLQNFGQRVWAQGIRQLILLPLFLQIGVHMREDIPAAIAAAQHALPPGLDLYLSPPLGCLPSLAAALRQTLSADPADAWVLLAHGSRRPGGNQPVEVLANQLGIAPAYWAVAPSLDDRLQACVAQGHRRIGVIPYFLFPGKITDQIAIWITEWQQHQCQTNTNLHLFWVDPLAARLPLATLLWDLAQLRFS